MKLRGASIFVIGLDETWFVCELQSSQEISNGIVQMTQKSQDRARRCGMYFALLWKKIYRISLGWDARCVAWAVNNRLPAWSGHIPAAFIILISLIGLLGGSFIIGCVILIICALLLLSGFMKSPVETKASCEDDHAKPNYERFSWENDRFRGTYDKHSWHQDDKDEY
ncbi:hypothetical protein SC171_05465 [Pantoea cypripedii]|uniref:hypothetical protein n=1 Tax=Pantoea cypripedii TaxID=55209 RepID=UPI002FCA6351